MESRQTYRPGKATPTKGRETTRQNRGTTCETPANATLDPLILQSSFCRLYWRLLSKGQNLQDLFLNALRREHIPVLMFLVNGIKLQGQVESFDQYVVLLKSNGTQVVYKHAISTILPARAVNFASEDGGESNN